MLHMLLSFAEYERDMIGERIRDKFAASRASSLLKNLEFEVVFWSVLVGSVSGDPACRVPEGGCNA
jgi:hypothetical protein